MSKRFAQSIKIAISVVMTLVIVAMSMLALPLQSVQAAPDDNEIMKKILANSISRCYNSTYIKKEVVPGGSFAMKDIFVWKNRNKGDILILNSLGGSMSCQQVFLGSNKTGGLNSLFGKTPSIPTDLGYTRSNENSSPSAKCMSISYNHKSLDSGNMITYTSNSICFGITSNGDIDQNSYPTGSIFAEDCVDFVCLAASAQGGVYIIYQNNYGKYDEVLAGSYLGGSIPQDGSSYGYDNVSWRTLYSNVSLAANKLNSSQGYANPSMKEESTGTSAFSSYIIKDSDYSKAAEAVFKYYTGSNNMDSQKFTNDDVDYLLNKAYAKMKSENVVTEDNNCFPIKDEALSQGYDYAKYNASQGAWCPVLLNDELSAGKTYNIAASNLKDLAATDAREVLKFITNRNEGYATIGDYCYKAAQNSYNEFNQAWLEEKYNGENDADKLKFYKEQMQIIRSLLETAGGTYEIKNGKADCKEWPKLDPDSYVPPTSVENNGGSTNGINNGSSPGITNGTDSKFAECLNNASSLGWILCPVLGIVGETVEKVYEDIEENWLPIDNNLISTTSGIYDAWKVFRDFANIVFVAMLMTIVLSQITGLGISNYGIKKMLPSLIVVAVLVNVSFLFCQVLVDVINVVGAEVGGIFSKIGAGGGTTVTGSTVVKGAIATIFNGAGITLAIGVTGYAIVTNPGLLVPILIFGLGLIMTLFFFYAILAVRKAGIYAMIILSPLAIICYALPNTKSFFDRWKKLFIALLTVYPICQIVTGGGQMISGLMLKDPNTNFTYNIVAVILSFAPIFLIPSLVKGSLAGLGNIGAKISQTGTKLRGLATNKLGNSDAAKRLRTTGAYIGATQGRELMNKVNDKLRKAKVIGGLVSGVEDSRLGKMIGKQNARRDAQAKVAYRKMLMDDAGAANISDTMTNETIENDLAAQEAKYQQEMVNNTAESILNGKGKYTDASGTEIKINASNLGSLTSAWEYYMNQYDATGDKSALRNAQAITQLMFENHGDKGRTAIMDKLKERTFNPISGIGTRTQSFNDLAQYINRNGKWMDKLKGADTGSYKMIGDAAKGGDVGTGDNMANLHEYNTAAHDKLNAGNVNELGDSFFHGVLESDKQGVFDPRSANYNPTRFNELTKIRDTFERTMKDPRTAEKIKPDMLREMNKINHIVYNGQLKQAFDKEYTAWQAAGHAGGSIADFNNDYKASHGGRAFGEVFGKYKDLTPP